MIRGNLTGIKAHTSNLKKLNNLLEDKDQVVYGVYYTNSFLNQRYLCRQHVLSNTVDIQNNDIELKIVTRVEEAGLLEIENTLDVLLHHAAGFIPGASPEESYTGAAPMPTPELVSADQRLYSVDLVLNMKDPEVTYQNFTLAGSKFTLVDLYQRLDEEFGHSVSLLFGEDKGLYLFSHLCNKDLTVRDMKLALDLIMNENITGKAIKGIKLETSSGLTSGVFPYEELISAYNNTNGDYIFGTAAGYIRIPKEDIGNYKFECNPEGVPGAFQLVLKSSKNTIRLYTE